MKKVIIRIVKGSEGYSLQIIDKEGNGYRYAGPKAWGNPTNILPMWRMTMVILNPVR